MYMTSQNLQKWKIKWKYQNEKKNVNVSKKSILQIESLLIYMYGWVIPW